jgi:hypothetical protein
MSEREDQLLEDVKAFLYAVIHGTLGEYVPANYRRQAEELYARFVKLAAVPTLEDCESLDCGCDGECERAGRGLPSSYDKATP